MARFCYLGRKINSSLANELLVLEFSSWKWSFQLSEWLTLTLDVWINSLINYLIKQFLVLEPTSSSFLDYNALITAASTV